MVGGNLVPGKSKKQPVVSKFCFEAEYQATALETCELLWLQILLYELGLIYKGLMVLHCDSTSVQNDRL